MKRVLHIIPRFTTGGAERLVLAYAAAAPAASAVASVTSGGELVGQFEALRVPMVIGGPRTLVGFWRTLRQIQALVATWRPEVIHTHIFSADVTGWLLKRNRPDLVWISTQHNGRNAHSAFRRFILRRILRRAARVVAVSEIVKQFAVGTLRISSARCMVVPNGIALEPFLAVSSARLGQGVLRFGVMGRLEAQKGHDILFQALALLKNSHWHLDIFGTGSLRAALERLAKRLKIDAQLAWHGITSDMPRALAGIEMSVQPSRFEGMSLSVMEAMAAGRVVVATDAAGRGLIQDQETGFLVPNENPAALAETLAFLMTHREKAEAAADRAQAFAREHFDFDNHLSAMRNLYATL